MAKKASELESGRSERNKMSINLYGGVKHAEPEAEGEIRE
jgi:hypothetical protein